MSSYESPNAVCPYYKRHSRSTDNYRVYCEGADGSDTISHNFHDSKARFKFTDKYCNDLKGCKDCVIHRALNLKYGILEEL